MAEFTYKGRRDGLLIDGIVEAEDRETAASRLAARGVVVLEVSAHRPEEDVSAKIWEVLGRGWPKTADLMLFARQLHTITRSGVPILRGLSGLLETTHNQRLRIALADVIRGLEGGRDLAGAMAPHTQVFGRLFVSIVRVGESTGTLPDALLRIYDYLRLEQKIRERVKSATRYPIIVLIAIACAIALISLWVLPRFAPLFERLPEVPWPTKVIMGVSTFASEHAISLAILFTAIGFGVKFWIATPAGRFLWHRQLLHLPIVGTSVQKAILARLCRSMALILQAGVPVVEGLKTIGTALGNDFMASRLDVLRESVERGESLSRAARHTGMFTPLVLSMLDVGEETGALDELLIEAAEFYEREVDYELENLSAALEPLLIVAVAGLVLILALGVFLPLWDMASMAKA